MMGTASTTNVCFRSAPVGSKWDDVPYSKILSVLLEALDLVLNVVDQKITEALLEAVGKLTQLALKDLLVKHLADGDAVAGGHGAVGWANTTLGGADAVTAELLLLETVDLNVAVGDDVASVGDEETLANVLQALGLEVGHLLEEGRDVDNGAGANEAEGLGVEEAGGEEVWVRVRSQPKKPCTKAGMEKLTEVVANTIRDNGVAGWQEVRVRTTSIAGHQELE